MCSDWNTLLSKGWERKEITMNGVSRIVYKTPPENGVKRTIQRVRDLRNDEKVYTNILFPKAKTTNHTHAQGDDNPLISDNI